MWNWIDVKKQIAVNKYDGLLPAYKGLHLHSIYGNFYAFIKNNKNEVLSIKEKSLSLMTQFKNMLLQADITLLQERLLNIILKNYLIRNISLMVKHIFQVLMN